VRPRLPDQLPALHLLRVLHRGLPHPCADDDQRVRDHRPHPRGHDLREAGPPGPARAGHARAAAPHGRGHRRRRLLPRRDHRADRGPGRVGPRAAPRGPEPRDGAHRQGGPRMMLPMSLAETGTVSAGEEVFFWVVAPLAVLAALGLLFARKAVYAAMCVVFVMISLAGFYIVQEALFLGVAQIVVYTGAIMMLFLFVLMLVGVDASDSVVETLKGQRWIGALAGAGLIALVAAVAMRASMPAPRGLAEANADTNPVGVARLLFSDYVLVAEVAGVLLVTAAAGPGAPTRADRPRPTPTQKDVADAKMAAFAAEGARIR